VQTKREEERKKKEGEERKASCSLIIACPLHLASPIKDLAESLST